MEIEIAVDLFDPFTVAEPRACGPAWGRILLAQPCCEFTSSHPL